jgi:hypothetical protein
MDAHAGVHLKLLHCTDKPYIRIFQFLVNLTHKPVNRAYEFLGMNCYCNYK